MSMRKGGAGEREAAPLPVKEQPPPYGYDEESEKDILGPEEEYQPCLIRYITAISRSTGIIIVCVMWLLTGVLLNHLSEHKYAPWYILAISILTTFFEIIWMLNKCVISCIREEGCCCAFWRFLVWIDNWRKTVLYVLFAIPCFLKDIFTVETCVVGLLLLVTAGVYFTKSFKESKCVRRRRRKDAYVQTGTPRASIVSHNVQVGRDGAPEGYHAKHVLPTTVQPRESERVSRSRTGSTQSEGEIEREGYFHKEGSKRGYDRAGGSPRFDRQRDPDRRTDFYEREGYDGRERDRDRDFSSERDHDRYKKDNRDYRRGRDHDRDRDRDYDRGRDHDRYRDRDYDRGRERYSVRDHPAERGHSWDRDHERGPSRSRGIEKGSDYREEHDQDKYYSGKVHGTRSSKSETKASEAETAIEKAQEPPPLKELPYQASKEMKKSAAANLVKQVSSGSPVSTTTGSAHSGMPSKIEQKAASMSNPYDKEKRGQSSTNPFDVQEDEYFD